MKILFEPSTGQKRTSITAISKVATKVYILEKSMKKDYHLTNRMLINIL